MEIRAHRREGIALAAALALFAVLTADLLLHGPLTAADPSISRWFAAHRESALTRFMLGVTALHSTAGLSIMSAGLAAVLLWQRRGRWILPLAATVQGGAVLNAAVKHLFARPRPVWDVPLVHLETFSFPSGHAAGATVFWGFLLVLWCAWQPSGRARTAFALLALLMVCATALSRVYLGAHYATDVLAGFAEGVAWVLLWRLLLPRQRP